MLESRKTLVVLTPDYLGSEWAEFENVLVQTLDPAARGRRLLPLILKECELPLRIGTLAALDFTDLDFAGSDDKEVQVRLHRLIEAILPPRIHLLPMAALPPEELREDRAFKELASWVRRGKAILFVGPGVAEDVGMPSSDELLDALRSRAEGLGTEISPDTPFTEAARQLEGEDGKRRRILVGTLRQEFSGAQQASPLSHRRGAYRLLQAIPQINRLIVTTNWDNLIRLALEDKGEGVGASTTEIGTVSQLVQLEQGRSTKHNVIKLRGDIKKGRMIITKADHDNTIDKITRGQAGRLWDYVAKRLGQYAFIFIGYRPEDPDLLLLEQLVTDAMGREDAGDLCPIFFAAPLPDESKDRVSQWACPIPAAATDLLLALFQELEEFSNRLDELDMIFKRRDKPFVEFYGYFNGKSTLLDRAEQMADTEGWTPEQIVCVNWDRRPDGTVRDPVRNEPEIIRVLNESVGPFGDFGAYLRDKNGVFLIFDATEHVQNQPALVSFLAGAVAPAILDMNKRGQPSKLLLAGRYPLPVQRQPYSFRRNLLSHALTPFDVSDVLDMAQRFLLATDPDSQEQFEPGLIAAVLEVSSGYTGFIKAILVDLTAESGRQDGHIALPSRLDGETKRAYVARFNMDIDQHVDWTREDLKQMYEETLCVFRWLRKEIVNKLALSIGEDLLNALVEIHVLSPDYRADLVIRRTKMLQLRYQQPGEYVEAHKLAQETFAAGMEKIVDDVQLDYILEWLFHTAHLLLAEDQDIETRRESLIKHVEEQVHYRAFWGAQGEMGSQLVNRIIGVGEKREDHELWNLLKECVGAGGAQEILDILTQKQETLVS